MSKSWDNSILKKLKTLMGKGLSTSEIGKRLGISKNAVVGKIHRLGWNVGGAEESKPVAAKKTAAKKTAPKKPVATKKAVVKVPAKKTAPAKKTVAKAAPKKKATPKVAKKTVKKPATAKVVAPKKEEPVAPKKTVGRAITGRNNNVGVHQRVVQHALEMANLKPDQCRWPIGDPDSEGFHFCGAPVFVGKPYCYEHCKQAYQFTPPKKKNN